MKSLFISGILAMTFYAIANVFIEQKFSKMPTPYLLVGLYAILLISSVVYASVYSAQNPGSLAQINLAQIAIPITILGLIYLLADYFYLKGYALGGGVASITPFMILFPAVAIAIDYMLTKELPSARMIAGYVCAAVAMYLIATGSKQN
jgi:drug/metabolite transporter (DMT)-like permease